MTIPQRTPLADEVIKFGHYLQDQVMLDDLVGISSAVPADDWNKLRQFCLDTGWDLEGMSTIILFLHYQNYITKENQV